MKSAKLQKLSQAELLPDEKVTEALHSDMTALKIIEKNMAPVQGDLIGVRLNLNVLKSTGLAIQTLHKKTNNLAYRRNKGFYNGEAIGYAQAVVLKNAFFNVSQTARENIATGVAHKFPMASVDGILESFEIPDSFEGVEIGFNPKTQHLFVDSNNCAIHSAEEVIVLGHRVYARGKIVYHTQLSAPEKTGSFPSQTVFLEDIVPMLNQKTAPPRQKNQ